MIVFFGLAKPGEGRSCGGARGGKGVRAFSMRHPVVPVEPGAATLLKRRHNLAELGMDWATVVALVVVLDDDFPVGFYVIGDGVTHSEVCEWVAL